MLKVCLFAAKCARDANFPPYWQRTYFTCASTFLLIALELLWALHKVGYIGDPPWPIAFEQAQVNVL